MGSAREGSSEFAQIKASLLQRKTLYEDPDFPAGPSAISRTSSSAYGVRWLRPKEIFPNAQFIVKGATRFDLNQGELQNCWFIAGTACLACSHPQLLERCVPPDQEFDKNYAGIFRFNFWRFGQWVEVIIDDRLPTKGGKLVYGSNTGEPHEFWVPLFEKAYAKLNGCYENLNGGFSQDALVDFTGGISEFIDITAKRRSPGNLFEMLYAMVQKSSLLGTHINATRIPEKPLPTGLYTGHAYSITNLVKLKVKGSAIRLLRIRNPWGKNEWNGRWSDNSKDWASIPEKVQEEVGRANLEDGEFWMSFEDWLANFEFLTICHLDPDAVTKEIAEHKNRQMWVAETFQSEWVRGFSAGGSGNAPYERLFWSNPQFLFSMTPKNVVEDGNCHVVVSLMQKAFDNRPKFGISFSLFQLKQNAPALLTGQNYSENAVTLTKAAQTFRNLREMSEHYELLPGKYIIIPCTFDPNQEGEFILRIFTETKTQAQFLDVPTSLTKEETATDNVVEQFNKCTGGDDRMDPKELMAALNILFSKGNEETMFGIEASRSILNMADKDRTGCLTIESFRRLVAELTVWSDKFRIFDSDRSGDIDTYELYNLFESVGFRISRKVLESIIRRYGGKKCRISFVDFIHCCCKLVTMYHQFNHLSTGGIAGKAELTLEQWLSLTLYY